MIWGMIIVLGFIGLFFWLLRRDGSMPAAQRFAAPLRMMGMRARAVPAADGHAPLLAIDVRGQPIETTDGLVLVLKLWDVSGPTPRPVTSAVPAFAEADGRVFEARTPVYPPGTDMPQPSWQEVFSVPTQILETAQPGAARRLMLELHAFDMVDPPEFHGGSATARSSAPISTARLVVTAPPALRERRPDAPAPSPWTRRRHPLPPGPRIDIPPPPDLPFTEAAAPGPSRAMPVFRPAPAPPAPSMALPPPIAYALDLAVALAASDGSLDARETGAVANWAQSYLAMDWAAREAAVTARLALATRFVDAGQLTVDLAAAGLARTALSCERFAALELCRVVVEADGAATEAELAALDHVADALGLDAELFRDLREKALEAAG